MAGIGTHIMGEHGLPIWGPPFWGRMGNSGMFPVYEIGIHSPGLYGFCIASCVPFDVLCLTMHWPLGILDKATPLSQYRAFGLGWTAARNNGRLSGYPLGSIDKWQEYRCCVYASTKLWSTHITLLQYLECRVMLSLCIKLHLVPQALERCKPGLFCKENID